MTDKTQSRNAFEALADFLGHDNGADVTSRDIVRSRSTWKPPDRRTGKLRHPNTILSYLSSFKGVFTVAVQSILLDETPMDKVAVGSKIESTRQSYSIEQVTLILSRAQTETDDIFLPLLSQAYSGAGDRRLLHAGF